MHYLFLLLPSLCILFTLYYFIWRRVKIAQELIDPNFCHLIINEKKCEVLLSYSNATTHELICRKFDLDIVRIYSAGMSPPSINVRSSGFGEPLSVDIYVPESCRVEHVAE